MAMSKISYKMFYKQYVKFEFNKDSYNLLYNELYYKLYDTKNLHWEILMNKLKYTMYHDCDLNDKSICLNTIDKLRKYGKIEHLRLVPKDNKHIFDNLKENYFSLKSRRDKNKRIFQIKVKDDILKPNYRHFCYSMDIKIKESVYEDILDDYYTHEQTKQSFIEKFIKKYK